MSKKLSAYLLAFLMLAQALALNVAATDYPGEDIPVAAAVDGDFDEEEGLPASATVGDALPAKSAILIDQSSGMVLFEKNADEQLHPASVTKIMTLLLAMEAIDSGRITMNDEIITSEHANSMGGSQIWLKVGEKMGMNDILKAVAISSANDASVALGEHIAGSEEAFVDMMNERAAELGMVNTHFENCSGLDAEGHMTTARDISIMSRELMKYPRIMEYTTVWMDSLRNGETQLVNTNKLVRFYKGATGLKTGTTSQAGSCLSATATRDNISLIAVVMGCESSQDRFASATGLLDYGFANYESVTPPPIDDQIQPVKVLHGVEGYVMPTYTPPPAFVAAKGDTEKITQEITLAGDVEAPVEKGQILGNVKVLVDGKQVTEYSLVAGSDVDRMDFFKAFKALLRSLLTMTYAPRRPAPMEESSSQAPEEASSSAKEEDASAEDSYGETIDIEALEYEEYLETAPAYYPTTCNCDSIDGQPCACLETGEYCQCAMEKSGEGSQPSAAGSAEEPPTD